MIKITNKNKAPVQLVVRSKKNPKAFVTLIVPGTGAGKNVTYLEDERDTEYLDRMNDMGLITKKQVEDIKIQK